MAETFSGSMKVSLNGTFTGDNDLSTVSQALAYTKAFDFTNGTGANQANMIFMDQRTISASGNDDLDLAGSLTNAYGTTITFTSIKGIIVYAATANTNDVHVGGAGSNQFLEWVGNSSDLVVVKPGGLLALVNPQANGYAVTASTGDILRVSNSSSGTSVTYDIILLGEV